MSARLSPKVAEAAQCDLSGNHARAVSLLAEACAHGDVEAMTRLGKRFLVAANAPDRPQEGAELITDAARLGGAEAAAQLAVLSAIGMFVDQSWEAALAALTFSAERGWSAAQRQLRILAADRELAAREIDPALWRQLAATIDVGRWHAPLTGATLSESPLVRHFPDFASAEVCEWLIDKARGRLVRAPVYSQTDQKRKNQRNEDQYLGNVQRARGGSRQRAGAGADVRQHGRAVPLSRAFVGPALCRRRADH